MHNVCRRRVHAAALQEICGDDSDLERMRKQLERQGWDSNLSNACPEHTKPTAGVAALVRKPGTARAVKPHTQAFAEIAKTGRVNINLCTLGCQPVYLICVYGWTNGHRCRTAADRTDALFLALRAEMNCLPPHPKIIMGDINATPDDLPTLACMLHDGCTDLGAAAHW